MEIDRISSNKSVTAIFGFITAAGPRLERRWQVLSGTIVLIVLVVASVHDNLVPTGKWMAEVAPMLLQFLASFAYAVYASLLRALSRRWLVVWPIFLSQKLYEIGCAIPWVILAFASMFSLVSAIASGCSIVVSYLDFGF